MRTVPLQVALRLSAVCVIAATAGTAFAQGRGPRVSPEDAAKAWTLQAQTVAKSLELDDAKTEALTSAYTAARKAHSKAAHESMPEGPGGGDPRGRFEAMNTLRTEHTAKLATALTETLGEEAGAKAAKSLGTFDRQLDGMTLALAGMELDADKQQAAMALVIDHAADTSDAMAAAIGGGDFRAGRDKRQELRAALDTEMAKILSEKDLSEWKEKTEMRRGRGGAGGGGGGGADES
jgi:hypothetical protein